MNEFIYGDPLPDAPSHAYRGDYKVGVRTIELVNPEQNDILNGGMYDRVLKLEIWYPASLNVSEAELVSYEDTMGSVSRPESLQSFTFKGRAVRDAAPHYQSEPYPLVIVSHGYPGSRLMMSYLTENLASKAYVVVAIDHMESTFRDKAGAESSLLNRPFDQEFVLNEIGKLSESDDFFVGLVDANNTAIVAHSLGAGGTLNVLGAGYNTLLSLTLGQPIRPRLQNNPDYPKSLDPRVKASVLFSPWGGNASQQKMGNVSMWQASALAAVAAPTFWIMGTDDDIAGSEAIRRLFDETIHSERYLLTFNNAAHNIALNPPAPEMNSYVEYERYSEPAWDKRRMNNISQHFVTAFLDLYLKGDEASREYIEPKVGIASDGVYATDENGNFTDEHSYWKGFLPRTGIGLSLRFEKP